MWSPYIQHWFPQFLCNNPMTSIQFTLHLFFLNVINQNPKEAHIKEIKKKQYGIKSRVKQKGTFLDETVSGKRISLGHLSMWNMRRLQKTSRVDDLYVRYNSFQKALPNITFFQELPPSNNNNLSTERSLRIQTINPVNENGTLLPQRWTLFYKVHWLCSTATFTLSFWRLDLTGWLSK